MHSHKNLPSISVRACTEIIENLSGPQEVKLMLQYLCGSWPKLKMYISGIKIERTAPSCRRTLKGSKKFLSELYEAFSKSSDIRRKKDAGKVDKISYIHFLI